MARRPAAPAVPRGLADEDFERAVERLVAAAEAQGLGRHVSDPAVLDRIAGLVVAGRPRKARARRGRAAKSEPHRTS